MGGGVWFDEPPGAKAREVHAKVERVLLAPSGGFVPGGGPSEASKARVSAVFRYLEGRLDTSLCALTFSGEDTRKSGEGAQGTRLKAAFLEATRGSDCPVVAYDTSIEGAVLLIQQDFPKVKEILVFCEAAFIGWFDAKLMMLDARLYRKVKFCVAPVDSFYRDAFPPDYVVAYNALGYLKLALKKVGPWQLVLFGIDRAINKETTNPAMLLALKIVGWWMRRDLKG